MNTQRTPFGLRMPDDLKAEVQALAEREERSMNSLINRVLRNALKGEKTTTGSQA
jgi:predicted HicB family RNase H-like nuclease